MFTRIFKKFSLKKRAAILALVLSSVFNPVKAQVQVGDTVSFGSFYQNNSKDKDPVLWTVLDSTDDALLLISVRVLDCQPFNKDSEDSIWKDSFIRSYLNQEFLNACFSKDEIDSIKDTEVVLKDNEAYGTHAGENTTDKIFLLSKEEVEKYFSDKSPSAKPTVYARENGAYYFDYAYNEKGLYHFNGNTSWWLRTPGAIGTYGARVNLFGALFFGDDDMVFSHNVGVRPALWVKSSALENKLELEGPSYLSEELGLNPKIAQSSSSYSAVSRFNSKQSDRLSQSDTLSLPQKANVGDEIKFGRYYTDGNKVKKDIVWKVLDVDGDKVLLISKEGLDCQDYNRWEFISNWAQSTIRDWLNVDFMEAAFNEAEKKRIEYTHVINYDIEADTAAGENTDDRLFLLSLKQAKNYFSDDASRIARPTLYARSHMASFVRDYYSEGDRYEGSGYWLLRSPDSAKERADYVDYSGALCDGVFTESLYYADINIAIRPAMWVNLKQDAQIPDEFAQAKPAAKEPAYITKDVKQGDKVLFGKYFITSSEQKEPILWQVLEADGNKALLITDYGVDNHFYNDEDKNVTWESCTARAFLNNDFLNAAFDAKEQGAIIESVIENYPNTEYGNNTDAGKATSDRVFLLSIDEARYLFPDNVSRRMGVTPYCKSLMSDSPAKNYGWWLRSPGETSDTAATVVFDGYVRFSGHKVNFFSNTYVLRPAVYVDLSKLSDNNN